MINKGDLIANRYLILDTLGEGGMSNVYLAEDTYLHRKVALKSLRSDLQNDKQIRLRFQRESRAMSKLSSPHIVNILDVGDEDEHIPYIVMEYVPGCSLKKYIQEHFPLPYQQVIDLMVEILQGVAVAHQHGIIHRDLKPQNIMITPKRHAKVADFGIALSQGEQSITQSNSTMGSVHYMAPERVHGQQASVQSDIYALGIILYEMLTNKLPFDGETSLAIALKHSKDATPSIRQAHPDLPQALENVVFKATAKDPKQRYRSALSMAADLKTTLLPQRAQEAVFVPIALDKATSQTAEATKVLDKIPKDDLADHKSQNLLKKKLHQFGWWFGSGCLLLIFVILTIWLASDKEVAVPDVSNLRPAQAQAVLNNSHLQSQVSSSEYNDMIAKDNIIRSVPPKGVKLKSGATVKLVRSLGPRKKLVPNVVGSSYSLARRQLKKAGFHVKRINRYSNNIPAGVIFKQTPNAHHKIFLSKQKVRLFVSLGQKRQSFILKDLTGYNLRGAQDYANEEGLQLEIRNITSNSVEKGLIVSQSPAAGMQVSRGTTLVVNISSGKPDIDTHNTDNTNSKAPSNTLQTVNKSITLPFDEQSNHSSSEIQIYIKDANHNFDAVYKTLNINSDTPIVISFQLAKGQKGQYRIVRDGTTLKTEDVMAG